MFDNICKFLAETFPTDYATWLLGEPIPLTKLEPQELSLEPLRADSVIFLQAPNLVLHLEFQTKPRENLPFRMADYYLRLYRKFPKKNIHQTIIYLTPSTSEIVYQNQFITPQLTHRFHIIRLWEQPTETIQNSLGLMPLAVLTQTPDAVNTLSQIAQTIETIPNPQTQSNLAAATAILSGLKLKPTIIQQLLRSDLMKESAIYQEILHEGELKGEIKGELKGEIKGQAKATRQIARNMLNSGLALDLISQLTGLTLAEIQELQ